MQISAATLSKVQEAIRDAVSAALAANADDAVRFVGEHLQAAAHIGAERLAQTTDVVEASPEQVVVALPQEALPGKLSAEALARADARYATPAALRALLTHDADRGGVPVRLLSAREQRRVGRRHAARQWEGPIRPRVRWRVGGLDFHERREVGGKVLLVRRRAGVVALARQPRGPAQHGLAPLCLGGRGPKGASIDHEAA